MKKLRNLFRSPVGSTILFLMAVVLLMSGTIGGVRANPQIFNPDFYWGGIELDEIGVTLMENDEPVSNRDYSQSSQSFVGTVRGALLQNTLAEGEHLKPGYAYEEKLAVKNSGSIPTYVRLTVYKYWLDEDGEKYDGLPLDLIELGLTENSGWVHDTKSDTNERAVYYYKNVLAPGAVTSTLTDTLRLDDRVVDYARIEPYVDVEKDGYQPDVTYTVIWVADGKTIYLEAEANAVQDHNARAAVKSAWGLTESDIKRLDLDLPKP